MEEEGGDRLRLIIGIVVVIIVVAVAIFIIRGFLTKKPTTQTNSFPSSVTATPTPYGYQGVPPTPTGSLMRSGSTTNGTTGSTYYYYQSQSSANSQGSQSQNQDGTDQSQSQTLPGGMTQTQNQ